MASVSRLQVKRMPLKRDKLIAEIAGLCSLMEAFTPAYLESVGAWVKQLMAGDSEFRRSTLAYYGRNPEDKAAAKKIRREELGGKGDGPLMDLLLPLSRSERTFGMLDHLIDYVCFCIKCRRVTDEQDRKEGRPHLEFTKDARPTSNDVNEARQYLFPDKPPLRDREAWSWEELKKLREMAWAIMERRKAGHLKPS